MFIRTFYVPHSILINIGIPRIILYAAPRRAYAILPYAFTESSSCYATMHNA